MTIERGRGYILLELERPMRAVSSASVRGGLVSVDTILSLHATTSQTYQRTPDELVGRFMRRHRPKAAASPRVSPTGTPREPGAAASPRVIGLLTAAPLGHAQFVAREEGGIGVFAVITSGVSNALNIAERTPTGYTGEALPPPGTINVVVLTSASLTDDCLISSVITATEAKSAALFDLGVKSAATGSQATGTGTDAVVVVSGIGNTVDGKELKFAGGHTLYGQLLGDAVFTGVRDGLTTKKTTDERALGALLERLSGSFGY